MQTNHQKNQFLLKPALGLLLFLMVYWSLWIQFGVSYRSSYLSFGSSWHFVYRYGIRLILCMVLFIAIQYVKIPFIRIPPWSINLAASILVMMSVINGVSINGAKRFLYIFSFYIHPGTIAIFLSIVSLVLHLNRFEKGEVRFFEIRYFLSLFLVIIALLLQPDYSRLVLLVVSLCVVGFALHPEIAGNTLVKRTFLIFSVLAALWIVFVMTAPFIMSGFGNQILSADSRNVLFSKLRGVLLLNPFTEGYEHRTALSALKDIGMFGAGAGQGSLSMSMKNATGAFLFAVIGEEWGWVGIFAILAFFFLYIYLSMQISRMQRDPMQRMMCLALPLSILIQALFSISASIALIPAGTITIPFLDTSPSSLLVTWSILAYQFKRMRKGEITGNSPHEILDDKIAYRLNPKVVMICYGVICGLMITRIVFFIPA